IAGGGGHKSVILYFCVFSGFLLALNALFPTQSDDLGVAAEGLKGAWRSYMNWNGRIFEMLRVAYIGAIAPSAYFVILNTFVAVAFIFGFFIFIFARLPQSFDDVVILSVLLLIVMYCSAFGSIFLWAVGSLNYLWAYCALVYSFIPYRLFWARYMACESLSKDSSISKELLKALALMLLCFIAGMGSEMVGITALVVHIGFFIYALYKCVRLPLWYYVGFVALGLGWLALYLSPGHAARIAVWWDLLGRNSIYTLGDILSMSLGEQITHLSKTYRAFFSLTPYMLCIPLALVLFERYRAGMKIYKIILVVIGCAVFLPVVKNHIRLFPFFETYDYVGILYFAFLLGFYVCMIYFYHKQGKADMQALFVKLLSAFVVYILLVGTTIQVGIPSRARLAYVLVMAVMVIFIYQQFMRMLSSARLIRGIQVALIAITCVYGAYVLGAYIDGRLKWNVMLDSIATQKREGKDEVIVKASTFTSFYAQYSDWGNPGDNPNEWPNTTYAHYFGVKAFRVE
ncbi:DUF6056 family protein, partial [uncultured Helicobacter sp.]|uniref:DUF6056 family protein n=1 Tax=uncultured Helicobacter sp. TaxID=175537 RepID=UPI0026178C1A